MALLKTSQSLTKKFSFLSRLIIAGIVIGFSLLIFISQHQQSQKITNELADAASLTEKFISEDFDRGSYQLKYIANQIRENRADKKLIANLFLLVSSNLNKELETTVTWSALTWIDAYDKLVVDGITGVIKNPVDLSFREYLKISKGKFDQTFVAETINGSITGRLQIPIAIGIANDRKKYLGTLLFCFDVDKLFAKISRLIPSRNLDFAIIRDSKIITKSDNFDEKSFFKNLPKRTLGEVIERQTIFSPDKQFFYVKDFAKYPFAIAISYKKQESYHQYLDIFFRQILIFTSLILIIILSLITFYHRIVRPINKLSNLASSLSEKKFDYVITRPKNKEFSELYDALFLVKDLLTKEEMLLQKLNLANQKISAENFNKSEFLAAISHDVRNPLSAIISFSDFIQNEKTASAEEIAEWARDIEKCASEVLQFINDLMDVNQIASGEFSIDLSEKIDVGEIIKRSVRVNRDFARRRGMEIIEEVDTSLAQAHLDPRRMKQIIVNLVSNAIKYSKENTKIKVYAKTIHENSKIKLRLIVEDQGFGMTEEQVKKALEKYGRIENENSGKIDSFGLGLPLVKFLVEAQNGKMKIESIVGVGTKVILTF
jgi:signal transduction histidine kinase